MSPTADTSHVRAVAARIDALEAERHTWTLCRSTLIERHGRAVALGVALRHVRNARSPHRILQAVVEVITDQLGVDAFEVRETRAPSAPVLASRGVAPGHADRHAEAPVLVPLGVGDWTMGYLVIHRLMPGKPHLDDFDYELLQALAPAIAVALHTWRGDPSRETPRPSRATPSEAPEAL